MINWLVFFPDQTRFEKVIRYFFSALASILSLCCCAYLLISKSDCSNTNLGVAIPAGISRVAFSVVEYSGDYPVLFSRYLCSQHQALRWAREEDIWLYPIYPCIGNLGSVYYSSHLVHQRLRGMSHDPHLGHRYRVRDPLLLLHLRADSCGSFRLPLQSPNTARQHEHWRCDSSSPH